MRHPIPAILIILCFCILPASAALAASASVSGPQRPVPAQPQKALFFPDEVELTVTEKLSPAVLPDGKRVLQIALPGEAREDSFFLSVAGKPAAWYTWHVPEPAPGPFLGSVPGGEAWDAAGRVDSAKLPVVRPVILPERELSPQRRSLLQTVVNLQDSLALRQGTLEALQSRINLWQKGAAYAEGPAMQPVPATDRAQLDGLLATNLAPLFEEQAKTLRAKHLVEQELMDAYKALDEFDKVHTGVLVVVAYDGNKQDGVPVQYSYVLPASCVNRYVVALDTKKQTVTIEQSVNLTQRSGMAWEKTDVVLSTTRRDQRLAPRMNPPWAVSLYSEQTPPPAPPRPMAAYEDALPMSAKLTQAGRARGAEESVPVPQDMGSFRLWNLGSKNLMHDVPNRLSLQTETYPADVFYTLRPAVEEKGFLSAAVTLEKGADLPSGVAQYTVDGVVVGEGLLRLQGGKHTLSFASDPQITAVMVNKQQVAGSSGLINKKQTLLWDWDIEINNSRNREVRVVLQDQVPVPDNQEITLKVSSTPQPEKIFDDGRPLFQWNATLPAGGSLTVRHKIEADAPADKILNGGRW